MVSRLTAALFAAALLAVGVSMNAHASCALPPPNVTDQLAAARVVFVGTVLFTSDNYRSARVKVESIWKGPDLPAYVDVRGEAPGSGPMSGSEADHLFQAGERYLFGPLNSDPPFVDYGDCGTLTQPYAAGLAAYAPRDARPPAPATVVDAIQNVVGRYWWPFAPIFGLAVGLVVVSIAVGQRLLTHVSHPLD